nr:PAS domain S-box protein [Chryseolinea lacunae]
MKDINTGAGTWIASDENRRKYNIPDEVPQDFWLQGIHPDDATQATAAFAKALADKNVLKFKHTYRYRGYKAQYFYIEDTMKFLRHADGRAYKVIGAWKDISDQRSRQQMLEDTLRNLETERERFKLISEISNAAMWDLDVATGNLSWYAGSKALDEFGLNRVGYVLGDWKNSLHEDDRDRVDKYFDDVLSSGSSRYVDVYRVKKLDGSYASMLDQATIIRDENGNAVRALGGWVDITRERQRESVLEEALQYQRNLNEELALREEELTSTEEELRQINEQLSENVKTLSEREFILTQSQHLAKIGSWDYDVQAKTMYWSNEMYNIFGVDHSFNVNSLNEIYGLFDENSGHLVKESFQNILQQQNHPFDLTALTVTPLGYKKWVRITAYPMLEGDTFRRVLGLTYDITYFKESEERLKASEEKFAKAFRNNPDLMTIMREEDFVIVDVNEKIFDVLGYTRQEVVGKVAMEFGFFVNDHERQAYYMQYFTHGEVSLECAWRRKEGRSIQIRLNSSRIEIEGKAFIISVIQDISERKAAEEKFQKAFDLNPDLTLIFRERDMVLVEANSKLEEVSYYKREEVIGRSSTEFNLWMNLDERQLFFEELFKHGEAYYEAMFLKKNGESFYGTVASSRINLSGERHIITIVRDITEKKEAEAKLISSEANLNATINNTEFFIWSINRQYQLTSLNKPWKDHIKRTYGADLEVGMDVRSFFKTSFPETQLASWSEWCQKVLSGEPLKVEARFRDRDFQYSLSPILSNDSVDGVAVFAEDITDRRLAERKILQNEVNMNAIINNSDMSIWSVDKDFRLMAVNNNFITYMREWYGLDYEVGQQMIDISKDKVPDEMLDYWTSLFKRALAGEIVLTEGELNNAYLQYSVNPIIEGQNVVGAAIYSRNITDRVLRERELLEANKKIGELKLMALRSVMNPHFIFNALNSIQFFIAKNDRLNAINYLSTFSKLIRGILTNSVKNKIRLADEIELLQHYVNLELVRFEDKFDCVFEVSPDLDVDNIEIPSLLIQPYVENAILHGLYNKAGKGRLCIRVQEDGDRVLFEIEDDGIGRTAALKLRQQNFPQHKSMGTVLTEERLKLVNQDEQVSYEVIDLFQGGQPAGTRVKIWIGM